MQRYNATLHYKKGTKQSLGRYKDKSPKLTQSYFSGLALREVNNNIKGILKLKV